MHITVSEIVSVENDQYILDDGGSRASEFASVVLYQPNNQRLHLHYGRVGECDELLRHLHDLIAWVVNHANEIEV